MSRELSWQEWLEIKNYQLPPPSRAPSKHEFQNFPIGPPMILPFPIIPFPPFDMPFENGRTGRKGKRAGRARHYSGGRGHVRFRNLFMSPYQMPLGAVDYPDPMEMMFMPLGQPGILLPQANFSTNDEVILPDEISNTILELEKDTKAEYKKFPKISCLDDSYLQNELDEMYEISPLGSELNESRDSGINVDAPSSPKVVSAPSPKMRQVSSRENQVTEKSHVCPHCSKKYLSNSGLKYHLKKATNSCKIKKI